MNVICNKRAITSAKRSEQASTIRYDNLWQVWHLLDLKLAQKRESHALYCVCKFSLSSVFLSVVFAIVVVNFSTRLYRHYHFAIHMTNVSNHNVNLMLCIDGSKSSSRKYLVLPTQIGLSWTRRSTKSQIQKKIQLYLSRCSSHYTSSPVVSILLMLEKILLELWWSGW